MAKIAVALSGGVDSSVALMLLKEAGHDLIGVTMRHLNDECFDLWEGSCCSRAAVMSASRLCKKYGIKHYIFELEKEFEEKVLAPTALTYASGKTPNPCCDCNEEMKFGMMFEKAREKVDVRFNFYISPEIGRYLDWISQRKKLPRSVFLRGLVERHMHVDKEYRD